MRLSICFRWYCTTIDVTTVLDHCIVARELTATASSVSKEIDVLKTCSRCATAIDISRITARISMVHTDLSLRTIYDRCTTVRRFNFAP